MIDAGPGSSQGGLPTPKQLQAAFAPLKGERAGLVLTYLWKPEGSGRDDEAAGRSMRDELMDQMPDTFTASTDWIYGHRLKPWSDGRVDFVVFLFSEDCG